MNAWKWVGFAALMASLLSPMTPAVAVPSTGEIEQLKSIVEQNPNSIKEMYKLGALYFLSKRFDDAIDAWQKILQNKNNGLSVTSKVKVAKGLALAHFKLARYPQAYKFIRWVYKQQPYDPKVQKAHDVIKKAYDNMAVASVQPIPPVVPDKPKEPVLPPVSPEEARRGFSEGEQLFKEGQIAVDQGQEDYDKKFSDAIKNMDLAVRGKHNLPKALYYLGSAHLLRNAEEKGDLDNAKKNLEESLKLDNDKNTLFNLAQTYGLLDDKEKEIAHYEKALELDGKWAECHFRLALAYDKSKRPDAARKTFEHAKAAIREKSDYKKKFQEVLKNSDVAKQIANIVSEIIEKSENDQLTDAETEKYAQKFQQMLGEKNLTANDLRDKNKVKELLNSDDAKKLLSGENAEKIQNLLNSEKGQKGLQKLQDRMLQNKQQ